ncbi:hypothetical protein R6Q59_010904 [Mikania micrantha]
MKDNSRTVDQIYSKWNDLNSGMKKWNGFYQQASMNRKSGEGNEHVLKKAMKNYKSVVKSKGFPHIQAWEMVRDNSLWCDIPPVGCQSQSTTKRPKPNESMGSMNAHINLDDGEDIDGQHDHAAEETLYNGSSMKEISNRKLLVVDVLKAKEAANGNSRKEEEEGWELRAAPLGPDPLHHHGAGPIKPRSP